MPNGRSILVYNAGMAISSFSARLTLGCLCLVLLAGCAAPGSPSPLPSQAAQPSATPPQLRPWLTPTGNQPQVDESGAVLDTPLPSPTATPQTHVVQAGEDMGGIAYRYGITLQALRDANPDVDPYSMSIGQSLIIPAAAAPSQAGGTPQPTPVGIQVSGSGCTPTAEGGAWCFALVANPQTDAWVESIVARFIVTSSDGQNHEQAGPALLDVAGPGENLPVAVYFPPSLAAPQSWGVEILSALPLTDPAARYLPARVEDQQVNLSSDRTTARVTGRVILEGEGEAASVWVAAAALDASGRVIGARRWESNTPLTAGGELDFDFAVYAAWGAIEQVVLTAQARR